MTTQLDEQIKDSIEQPEKPATVHYYRKQALEHGAAATSTMLDEIVREKEIDATLRFLDGVEGTTLLEVGCGNGFLLNEIAKRFGSRFQLHGIDLTPEMLQVARSRNLDCEFSLGDIRHLPYESNKFDVVVSERVVVNILEAPGQIEAFSELARVLKPGCPAVVIEAFRSGLANLNQARAEFLLPAIPEPAVNSWFTEELWQKFLATRFREFEASEKVGLAPENFLSSHYFMTRFLHDAIRPAEGKLRNTEFGRFFASALPPTGDYSPIRIKYLRKIGSGDATRQGTSE